MTTAQINKKGATNGPQNIELIHWSERLRRYGWLFAVAYATAVFSIGAAHTRLGAPGSLRWLRDYVGVISALASRGANADQLSAFFFYALILSPAAFISCCLLCIAERPRAPRPRPWHPLVGLFYGGLLVVFVFLFRPNDGGYQGPFRSDALNMLVGSEILLATFAVVQIWSIALFLTMALIYPATLVVRLKN